mgnify:CR=1 FL=1
MAKGKKKDKDKKRKAKDKAAKRELEVEADAQAPVKTTGVGKHAIRRDRPSFTMPEEDMLYGLSNLFKIFADPTRLKILFSLVEGPKCVADISAAAGVTQGATSHQLRNMKQESVVDFVRDGKQVIYSLADDRVQALLAQGLSYIDE